MKKCVWLPILLLGLLASCNPLHQCSALYTGPDGKVVLECQR